MGFLSGLFGSSTKKTSFNQQTDPWDEAIPQLREFLGNIEGLQSEGFAISPEQQEMFSQLKTLLAQGNPEVGAIQNLASGLLNTGTRSPAIEEALKRYEGQVGDVAAGKNMDVLGNPEIQKMLQQVGGDIATRINAQFAGAGRDLSGINQKAVASGVTSAQLPILLAEYARQQGRTDAARQGLLTGSLSANASADQADLLQRQLQEAGINVSKEGMDALTSGPTAILNLLQQMKELPVSNAGQFLQLLGTVGGMGNQSSGTSTQKTSGGGGIAGSLLGGVGKALGTSLGYALSDKREKKDVQKVGTLADGTPIYLYRYKDDPEEQVHMGPMAQEVEERNPSAVAEDQAGRKYVNLEEAAAPSIGLLRQKKRA